MTGNSYDEGRRRAYWDAIQKYRADLDVRIKDIEHVRNPLTHAYRDQVDPVIERWLETQHIMGLDEKGHRDRARSEANAMLQGRLTGEQLKEFEDQRVIFESFDPELVPLVEKRRVLDKDMGAGFEALNLTTLQQIAKRCGISGVMFPGSQ